MSPKHFIGPLDDCNRHSRMPDPTVTPDIVQRQRDIDVRIKRLYVSIRNVCNPDYVTDSDLLDGINLWLDRFESDVNNVLRMIDECRQ